MKVTTRNFLIAMVAPAFVAASAGLVAAGTKSSAKQVVVTPASVESFVYFPAQYTLNAPSHVSEHIQAF